MLLRLVEDVERAIEHECYFAALALALTLPDICGQAEFPYEGNGARYTKWCRQFVCEENSRDNPYSGDMPYLNDDMLYNLRCAFLHQGIPNPSANIYRGKPPRYKDERCKVDHFTLEITDPDSPDGETAMVSYTAHMKIDHREIKIGVRDLCYRLRIAAKKYYEDNPDKFTSFDFDIADHRRKSNPFYQLQEDS